jgi:hypothetical protein
MFSAIKKRRQARVFSGGDPIVKANRIILRTVLAIMLLVPLVACRKAAEFEGRVQDGQGRPIADITLIATAQETAEGSDQLSAVTDAGGTFRFKDLRPSTRYLIVPRSEQWTTEAKLRAATGGTWRAVDVDRPFIIRFTKLHDVIRDSKTGLEWRSDLGKTPSWTEANELIYPLNALPGENGWRLPTEQELLDIYSFRALDKQIRIDDIFHLADNYVWTSELVDYRQAPDTYFTILAGLSNRRSTSMGGMLDLAVSDPATYLEKMAANRMDMSPFVRYFDFSCGEDKWMRDPYNSRSFRVLAVRTPSSP